MKCIQNESRFNGVYSRNNLHDKTKDVEYVINLHDQPEIGTHWIALYALINDITYFDSFGVEHISKEIKNLLVIKTQEQIFLGYKHMIQ